MIPALIYASQMQQLAQAMGEYSARIAEGLRESPLGRLLDYEWGGLLIVEVIFAVLVILLGLLARRLLIYAVDLPARRRGPLPREWSESLPFLITRAIGALMVLAALFIGFSLLTLPTSPLNWKATLWRVFITIAFIWITFLIASAIEYITNVFTRGREGEPRLGNSQLMPVMRDLLKVGIVVLGVYFIVQTWGYNATALLAGVGLGGLAIAFAAQDTIANLFGTMVVYSDRPYKVGDHVIIAGIEGTVEEIGVRSTRIRKFDRTVVSVPNKSVANENISNLTLMNHRRIRFRVPLEYSVAPAQIEEALEALRLVLSTQDGLMPNQYWAYLYSYGSYSQDILLQCFTEGADYERYLEIQEELLLRVRRRLAELGLDFAHARPLLMDGPPAE